MSRIEELEKRLAADPNSRIFVQLAEEYRKQGLLDEAIDVCKRGLENHPQYPSARVALGRALLEAGTVVEASQEFESVLAQVPDNILANKFLGETYARLGRRDEAIAKFETAQMLSPEDAELAKRIQQLRSEPDTPAPDAGAPGDAKSEQPIDNSQGEATIIGAPPFEVPPPPAPMPVGGEVPHAPIEPGPTEEPARTPMADALSRVAPGLAQAGFAVSPAVPAAPPEPLESVPTHEAIPTVEVSAVDVAEDPDPSLSAGEVHPVEVIPEIISTPMEVGASDEIVAAEVIPEPSPSPIKDTELGQSVGFESVPTGGPVAPQTSDAASQPVAEDSNATSTASTEYVGAVAPARPDESPQPLDGAAAGGAPSTISNAAPEVAPGLPSETGAIADDAPSPAGLAAPEARSGDIETPTMAELYASQGYFDRAIEVYERLASRDPQMVSAHQKRIGELKTLASAKEHASVGPVVEVVSETERDEAIRRLEDWLTAIRKVRGA